MSGGEGVEGAFTPSTLLSNLRALVEALQATEALKEGRPLLLKGIYKPGNGKGYANGYYDTIEDPHGLGNITAIFPGPLRAQLAGGDMVLLKGSLGFHAKAAVLEARFAVSEVLSSRAISEEEKGLRKVLEAIAAREKKDVRTLLKKLLQSGRKPRLLFLYGRTAITDADVESGLQPYAGSYEIEAQRISMSNPREILDALKAAAARPDRPDAVALIRGGGSGLEVFSDPELILGLQECPLPLITAIGHEKDRLLVQNLADLGLSTPTALGHFLRELAQEIQEDREKYQLDLSKALQAEREEKEALRKDLEAVRREKEGLADWAREAQGLKGQLLLWRAISLGLLLFLLLALFLRPGPR